MISLKDFNKINDWIWEVPQSFRADMRAPARAYVSEKMLKEGFKDRSLSQLINLATLPGILKYSLAMPDMHEGYGSPIGGVVATDVSEGIISPGVCGYDINCGVRLLKSNLNYKDIQPHLDRVASAIQKEIPSGLGIGRKVKLDAQSINRVLEEGAQRLIQQGYGEKEDAENCESGGKLDWANSAAVSERAKERGRSQVGTLGSGNHFLEIQKVEKIFDKIAADLMGLAENQIVLMVHTGSRGLGHQICTDYLKIMIEKMPKYHIKLPDPELAAVPFGSPEGGQYFSAMAAAANFAWANRQMITHFLRKAWRDVLGERMGGLNLLYDVAHNIIKKETYIIDGKKVVAVVHRKGATRAFPPESLEIPQIYRKTGQPVLIPGSMGTASYVLAGVNAGEQSFYSSCHGAGRRMSRHRATRTISGQEVIKQLAEKGIIVKCWSQRGIAEEAPLAYKDVDEVVDVVQKAGLSKKVARLVPVAVIKGE